MAIGIVKRSRIPLPKKSMIPAAVKTAMSLQVICVSFRPRAPRQENERKSRQNNCVYRAEENSPVICWKFSKILSAKATVQPIATKNG